ncbi:MAG: hypothetical protein ACTSRP_12130, partial [Candidatus Helarchaeota archaeon]
MILNQSENDYSTKSVYWSENINMTVKPYSEFTETFAIDLISTEKNPNSFRFSIPQLSTDWNISQIKFDIYNITFNKEASKVNINITDPYGVLHTFNNTHSGLGYYAINAPNGTWENIIIQLNKGSISHDNSFNFKIEGTFTGSVDIFATLTFKRDRLKTEYNLFNRTDSINIKSDGNGWIIKNITFNFYNCYDPNTWNLVNPATVIDKIITNEGLNYTLNSGSLGSGSLTIDNITIYPLDNQFLFTVLNNSNIMFDVEIIVEYVQGFYPHNSLDTYNLTTHLINVNEGAIVSFSSTDKGWDQTSAILSITNIQNATGDSYSPSDLNLNVTINSQKYIVGDEGLSLMNLPKNQIFTAILESAKTIKNYSLYINIIYNRKIHHEIKTTINYVIREAPDETGSLQYIASKNYYLATIDTSKIEADDYTIRFTSSKSNYITTILDLDLSVLERPTTLNGNSDLITQILKTIYIKTAYNFTFTYIDLRNNSKITDLNIQSYNWKRFEDGTVVDSGTGNLISTTNNTYILDFNTELLEVGEYTITVTLSKNNYEQKIALINLNVIKRVIDYNLGSMFTEKQASVVKGDTLTIQITLSDPTNNSRPLTGA